MKKILAMVLALACMAMVLASCSAVHAVALTDTWGAEIDGVYGEITFNPDNTYSIAYETDDGETDFIYGRWATDSQQLILMDEFGNVEHCMEYTVDANYLTFSEDIVFERK